MKKAWGRKIVGRKMAESLRQNDETLTLPQRREERREDGIIEDRS